MGRSALAHLRRVVPGSAQQADRAAREEGRHPATAAIGPIEHRRSEGAGDQAGRRGHRGGSCDGTRRETGCGGPRRRGAGGGGGACPLGPPGGAAGGGWKRRSAAAAGTLDAFGSALGPQVAGAVVEARRIQRAATAPVWRQSTFWSRRRIVWVTAALLTASVLVVILDRLVASLPAVVAALTAAAAL